MYTTPDEDRSDLLLVGAVFVFGPILLSLLLTVLPLHRIPVVSELLRLAQPVLLTMLVPFLLVRYRRESWGDYRFSSGFEGFGAGVLVALPVVAASLVWPLSMGASPLVGVSIVPQTLDAGWVVGLIERVLIWSGLALLVVYSSTKARDAFRGEYRSVRDGMMEIGRILAVVVAAISLVRLLMTQSTFSVIMPLGLAAAAVLAYRAARGPSALPRPGLLAPTILLALGSVFIAFSWERIVNGIWTAAAVATAGLVMAVLAESRRSAWAAVGFALTLALLTDVPVPLRLV